MVATSIYEVTNCYLDRSYKISCLVRTRDHLNRNVDQHLNRNVDQHLNRNVDQHLNRNVATGRRLRLL